MKSYIDLIEQTFEFPTQEFKVVKNELLFNGVKLSDVIKEYGTPLKITYLPKISEHIQYLMIPLKNINITGAILTAIVPSLHTSALF